MVEHPRPLIMRAANGSETIRARRIPVGKELERIEHVVEPFSGAPGSGPLRGFVFRPRGVATPHQLALDRKDVRAASKPRNLAAFRNAPSCLDVNEIHRAHGGGYRDERNRRDAKKAPREKEYSLTQRFAAGRDGSSHAGQGLVDSHPFLLKWYR